MTDKALAGKIAIVTGAASGLGWAIASTFVDEGATTYLLDRTDDVMERASELGRDASGIRADVSSASEIRDAFARVLADQGGRIDVLCNNAGIHGEIRQIGALSERAFDDLVAVNFKGVFLGMREVLPIMAERGGGSVINIASIGGSRGIAPRTVIYAATKAAVIALTQGGALEYGPAGIRVNAICPGVMRTPMEDASLEAAVIAATPLRRKGEASDIARVAVFLAGDDSVFVTGETIVVDGGITLKLPVTHGEAMWSEPGWASQRYES